MFTVTDLRRETFLDVQFKEIYELYKTHQQIYWTPEEIDLTNDKESFDALPSDEKQFIKKISTFFLISDAVVSDNVDLISTCTDFREAKAFYAIQNAIENVHIEVYGNIFSTLFDSKNSQLSIDEITAMPSVIRKRSFCMKDYGSMSDRKNLGLHVLSNTLVEGVFFAASFSGILWLKKRGKCPGIVKANEYIARDERLHWRFGCEIFKRFFSNLLTNEEVYGLVLEVYNIEEEFITDIISRDIGEMTQQSLTTYVKFCCNEILENIGLRPYFTDISQPFEFMKFLNYPVKANFFETRVTNYSLPSTQKRFTYNENDKLVYS
jgi:Ribonucleotide reductase, beta subunit